MTTDPNELTLRAGRNLATDKIDLYGFVKKGVIKPVEVIPAQIGERVDPFLTLSVLEAQMLMDELWIAGLRPTEGTGSAGSLAATQDHLKDLRKLLFHEMGVE